MSTPAQAIFQYAGLKPSLFTPASRYNGIATGQITTPDGKTVVYVRRRFVPAAGSFEVLHRYTVAQGDRLDNVASAQLGDPELYWRLCDANGALQPAELEAPGLSLAITLPAGIPGPTSGLGVSTENA